MARKKVKLEWISNDAARRATFKKRRKGLMKKVSELSTLCDVKACLVVYGHNEPVPEVWPSAPEAVRVLGKLKRMPEMERMKKMMDNEGFIRQRIAKLQDQLRKQDRENRELETTLLMNKSLMGEGVLGSLGIEEVTSLAWFVEMKVSEVRKRIEGYNGDFAMAKAAVKVQEAAPTAEKGKSAVEVAMEELQRQEWFTDIMNNNGHEMRGYTYMEHDSNIGSSGNNPWIDSYFPLN